MTVQQRLWFSFGITFILLLVITVVGYYQSKQVSVTERWVTHTYKVLAVLEGVTSELKDAETGQRGYLLTSEEAYLEPYHSGLINVSAKLQELAVLIADNPQQQPRVAQIGILADKKLAELAETIRLHRSGRAEAAIILVKTDLGKDLMDAIRVVIKEIREDEELLLEERHALSEQTINTSQWIVIAGSLLIIFVAALVSYLTSKSISKDYNQLQATEQSLEVTNQELQSFVYRTSHDFRSPLLGIQSMAKFVEEDLRDGNIEEARENVGRISKNADSLETLVASTLQLAKTDLSDNLIETIDVKVLVADVFSRLEGFAKGRNVELRVGSDMHNSLINTDSNHLMTVLENLVSNGIKYSDDDHDKSFVSIDITKANTSNAAINTSDSMVITINDNGVGIPSGRQTEVFGMFKQFHPGRANGTGLGMYIVKKSVDRLSGNITFDSSNKGTQFCITIPNLLDDPESRSSKKPESIQSTKRVA
jgi:CHASE3 domain sensor protein/anti-sigma regulatory factor (Ser/Thr protein kinase)